MSTILEVENIIGTSEGETLEYIAVLPPSRSIARLICAFSNAVGGYIVIGVSTSNSTKIEVIGLSEEFHANTIIHKAIDLLTPKVNVEYFYMMYNGKRIYVVKIDKSPIIISLEGKIYKRINSKITVVNSIIVQLKKDSYIKLKNLYDKLIICKENSTSSKIKLVEHYQSIIKIFDDLSYILYPIEPKLHTSIQEGKILLRILFSSFVDTFETYLSDLLYEIFLANPATLISKQQVSIEEVLNCSDLQEFIQYWAKQKLSKLQKGSVKGFIQDNKQIKDLNAFDENQQTEIEKILQIRHLYAHRNGIIDEKFIQFFPGLYGLNIEHQMSIDEVCDKLNFLIDMAHEVDVKAIHKYNLA